MDGEFVSVRTWQGFIRVSTALLPQSFDEGMTMATTAPHHPESNSNSSSRSSSSIYGNNNTWESKALPYPQRRSYATSAQRVPPPVPNYWHHEMDTAVTSDANTDFLPAVPSPSPSISYNPSSSHPQTYSPVYTPRTDDDVVSIPDGYSFFSPWEPIQPDFTQLPHGDGEWGDGFAATDWSLFPTTADRRYSFPSTHLPAQSDAMEVDDGEARGLGLGHDGLVTSSFPMGECPGMMPRSRRFDATQVF